MSEVNELVEFDKIAAGIKGMQEQGNFLPDMSTKEGYEASKRFVLDVTTPTRTKLDKAHKTAKSYWVAGGQNVDAKKNEIMNVLVDIQKPHQEAYKEFDQIAKDKKLKFESDLQDKIDVIYYYRVTPPNANSTLIAEIIQTCGETDTQEGFYHKTTEAAAVRLESLSSLNESLMGAVAHEAEQERQAQLAEENRIRQIEMDKQQESMRLQQEEMNRKQEEIQQKEYEQDAIAIKAEQEKNQIESDRKLKIKNEERAKQDEIDRKKAATEREEHAAKQAEIAAEQAKQEEQARQQKIADDKREADEKRASNNSHVTKCKKQAKESFVAIGLSEGDAVKAVQALSGNEIKNCSINY